MIKQNKQTKKKYIYIYVPRLLQSQASSYGTLFK